MKLSATIVNVLAVVGALAATVLLVGGAVALANGLGDDDEGTAVAAPTVQTVQSGEPGEPVGSSPGNPVAVDADDVPLSKERAGSRRGLLRSRNRRRWRLVPISTRSDDIDEAYEVEVLSAIPARSTLPSTIVSSGSRTCATTTNLTR